MKPLRELRADARAEMGVGPRVRVVRCVSHGQRGRIENVYAMNNWQLSDGELTCEPSHPFCFAWCDRAATTKPDLEMRYEPLEDAG